MNPETVEIIGLIVVPIALFIVGYFINNLDKKLQDTKDNADKEITRVVDELKMMHKKDDAIREIDRIDKDLDNLRVDVNKGFDVIRNQMSKDKDELLQAIANIK